MLRPDAPPEAEAVRPQEEPAAVSPAGISPAVERFRSCRWRRPPEDGSECCTHRDVLPIAGTSGFNPDSWCPECQYFKARRAPRRKPDPDRYW